MPRFVDRTGHRYGRLLVIRRVEQPSHLTSKKNSPFWLCRCDCGNETVARANSLVSGHTNSCGCYRLQRTKEVKTTHGHTRSRHTPTYKAWLNARNRCFNPKYEYYAHYGGRGITMCDGWRHSFKNFLASMGKRPSNDLSIDRIQNGGNYSCGACEMCLANRWPMNCRWATRVEQRHNRR